MSCVFHGRVLSMRIAEDLTRLSNNEQELVIERSNFLRLEI